MISIFGKNKSIIIGGLPKFEIISISLISLLMKNKNKKGASLNKIFENFYLNASH